MIGRSLSGHFLRSKSGGYNELYQESFNPNAGTGEPETESPRAEQFKEIRFTANYIKAGESPASHNSYDGHDNKLDGGSVGASEGQPITQSGTPGSTDQGSISRQLDDLALNGTREVMSGDGQSRWDMKLTGQVTNAGARTPTTLDPDFEGAFLPDERGNLASGGVASDSPVGQRSHGSHGDSESEPDTDKAPHSKSDENGNAQQRGDAWEGSMFPFCEEGEPGLLHHIT